MYLSNSTLFKYFEDLGYSEKEAYVLATLQYGNQRDRVLSYVMKTYKIGDNFIEHAYNTLQDPKTKENIQREIDEENRRREEEARKWEEEQKIRAAAQGRVTKSTSATNVSHGRESKGFFQKIGEVLSSPRGMHSRSKSASYSITPRALMTPDELHIRKTKSTMRSIFCIPPNV